MESSRTRSLAVGQCFAICTGVLAVGATLIGIDITAREREKAASSAIPRGWFRVDVVPGSEGKTLALTAAIVGGRARLQSEGILSAQTPAALVFGGGGGVSCQLSVDDRIDRHTSRAKIRFTALSEKPSEAKIEAVLDSETFVRQRVGWFGSEEQKTHMSGTSTSTRPLPASGKAADLLRITVQPGVYPMNKPLRLGMFGQETVTLYVGDMAHKVVQQPGEKSATMVAQADKAAHPIP